ncbi:hypothetical protein [Embleya sp. NPDC005575]|uniref:hypothetical protein n=1 Tax=Embleya sp. NPDC005575 TaxID=3156892 RepID=UPI0033AA29D7
MRRALRMMINACVATSLVVLAGATESQAADRPGGSVDVPDSPITLALRADAVAAYQAIEALSAAERTGYSSLMVDPEARDVKIYWKGQRPDRLARDLQRRGLGNRVLIKQAPFNRTELLAAVKQAIRPGEATLFVGGRRIAETSRVVAANPDNDGAGISVTVDEAALPETERRITAASVDGTVRLGATEIPATITAGPVPVTADLRGDTPRRGGAFIRVPGTTSTTNAATCTAGFVVINSAGARRMMTAAHCARKGQQVSYSGGSRFGQVETSNSGTDVAMYDNSATTNAFQGVVATGGAYNNTNGQTLYTDDVATGPGIKGADTVIPNTLGWVSGALSGEQGYGTINSVDVCINYSGWQEVCGLYRLRQDAKLGPLAGEGDSGGPVFWRVGGGTSSGKVWAQGVVSGIEGGTTGECPNNGWRGTRKCSAFIYVAPMGKAMDTLGARGLVITG